MSFAMEDYLDW